MKLSPVLLIFVIGFLASGTFASMALVRVAFLCIDRELAACSAPSSSSSSLVVPAVPKGGALSRGLK